MLLVRGLIVHIGFEYNVKTWGFFHLLFHKLCSLSGLLCPPGSTCQEAIKRAKYFLWLTPMNDKEETKQALATRDFRSDVGLTPLKWEVREGDWGKSLLDQQVLAQRLSIKWSLIGKKWLSPGTTVQSLSGAAPWRTSRLETSERPKGVNSWEPSANHIP